MKKKSKPTTKGPNAPEAINVKLLFKELDGLSNEASMHAFRMLITLGSPIRDVIASPQCNPWEGRFSSRDVADIINELGPTNPRVYAGLAKAVKGNSTSMSQQSSGQGNSHSDSRNNNLNWQFLGRKLAKPEEIMALPERVAITFCPGVPPIATRLIRYYENEFKHPPKIGPVKAVLDTASLFIAVALFAVMFTVALFSHTFK